MRVHRKGWTYTNLHLSLPIAIEDVDFLDSYLIYYLVSYFVHSRENIIRHRHQYHQGHLTNINKHIKPFAWLDQHSRWIANIHKPESFFFFRSFRKLLCRSLVEKPSPSIQTLKNYITHRIGRIALLPIYYLTTLLNLRFLVGIVVSTLWLNNSQTGKEPLKRLPLGSHGRQECGAWGYVRHIHYLHRS